MTEESICAKCAELIRMKVRTLADQTVEERVCGTEDIDSRLQPTDTVEECSRFVEAPELRYRDQGIKIFEDKDGNPPSYPRPRYLPHDKKK